jgi:hypothetical protein
MKAEAEWIPRRLATFFLIGTLLASCAVPATDASRQTPPPTSGATPDEAAPTESPDDTSSLTEVFPYDRFSDPTTIDNPYLPLQPGTYWKWDGITVEDDEELPHQIITMVTDLTKVIDGVTTVVGYDEDWAEGVLVEAEIWFAVQDDDGTVWRLGEYPEEYADGDVIGTPAWLAGAEDALAGIMMPAEPRRGEPSYAQGWGPAVAWADRGWVIVDGRSDCVTTGCYEDVIVVQEWDIAEPLARQLKFHAPGIGVIRVDWSGSSDQSQENLELIEFKQLNEAELADLRSKALALEERAYQLLPEVYGPTQPMERRN